MILGSSSSSSSSSSSGTTGEASELAQVLAFLDSEEANADTKESASFLELFGIPESQLDRSQAVNLTPPTENVQEKNKKTLTDLPDGSFDLTKFTATFDRVAKVLGCN